MRLISLEFEGVGSFADRMQVDFEALGGAGLFLIEGPTGAGKSTILDAIVFALYGSPAGSESDPGRLDSHVRDGNREPFVELVFAVGGATYSIRRTPRHERDKKRGTGMRVDDGGVALVRVAPDPAGISSKAREVGDWVIEHIGLTKQQFVSTIVLAQGEFSTFLNAETRERTPILEKVFGTEFYQEVEQQLSQMRKAAIAQRAEAAQRWTEAVDRCLGLLTIQTPEDPVAAIDAELVRLGARVDQAQAYAMQCAASLKGAQDQLTAAQELVTAQDAKRELLRRREELQERSAGIDALRAALSDHDRAQPVMAALHAWRDVERAARRALAHLEEQRAALVGLGESEPTDQRLEDITALRASLAHAEKVEAELPAMRRTEKALVDQVQRADAVVAEHGAERDDLLVRITQVRQAAHRPAGDGERLAALEIERSRLVKELAAGERLAVEEPALAAAQVQVATSHSALDDVLERLKQARRAQLANLAGTLASELVDGEACLVCGSVEHPQPARPESDSTDVVDELEALAERRRSQLKHAETAHAQLDARVALLKADLTIDPQEATQRLPQVEQELTALRAAIESAEQAAVQQLTSEARLAVVEEELAKARLDGQQGAAELTTLQAHLQEAEAEVTASAEDHPSVSARVHHLTAIQQALKAALEAQRAFDGARTTAAHAQETLSKTLAGAGLADVQAVEAAVLDPSLVAVYRAQIEEHDVEVVAVGAALQDASDVDLEAVADVDGLSREVKQWQDAHSAAQKDLGSLQHTVAAAGPLRDQVDARAAEQERVLADTAGVIRMADLATASRGEGIHRVRLSAFVLMRRFEAVVEAANDRLDAISEGRYQLKVEHKGLDNRGQHGLDLVVMDQRTERCRPTTSLSGGESFYVSLALALGLADVVRSESGGVSLGTLFIDEGFGSLDDEILEEVIDMLEQVRAGEDRVIGLVSHVDLLKQRIDPRISVRRDPQRPGVSTLAVHV